MRRRKVIFKVNKYSNSKTTNTQNQKRRTGIDGAKGEDGKECGEKDDESPDKLETRRQPAVRRNIGIVRLLVAVHLLLVALNKTVLERVRPIGSIFKLRKERSETSKNANRIEATPASVSEKWL